jgi:hypothetical protein
MLVTLAMAVPAPFWTEHFWAGLEGCATTVTLYALPFAIGVAKWKLPFAVTDRLSAPLFCKTNPSLLAAARFVSVPEMVYVDGWDDWLFWVAQEERRSAETTRKGNRDFTSTSQTIRGFNRTEN